MIPTRLRMRNFMCYSDNVEPLDLTGIHLACLSGDNGHGKSTVLDAITWALWGKARAKSDDDLIMLGRSDMEVELDFNLNDVDYRVLRRRALRRTAKRTSGVSTLELQVLDEGGYRTISGNSIGETQRKINDALRMEYETFINSSFILQNRADEFTTKAPAERKRVLADILGLDFYDQLESRARELAREKETERRELAVALNEIDEELAHKPRYEAQLGQVKSQVEQAEAQAKAANLELQSLRERCKELDLKARQRDEVVKQATQLRKELEQIASEIAEQQKTVASLQDVLARSEEIVAGCARLEAARARVEVLTGKLSELMKLNDVKNKLEREIQAAAETLRRQQEVLKSRRDESAQVAQRIPLWREDQSKVLAQLETLADLENQREAERARLQSGQSQVEMLKLLNNQLRQDMKSLKERLDALGQARAICPLCETEIGDAGRQALMSKLQAEGQQLAQSYRENEAKGKELEREITLAQQKLQHFEQAAKTKSELQRRAVVLEKSLADGEEAVRKAEELRPEMESIERTLVEKGYAEQQRQELARVLGQVEQLAYDGREHEVVRDEVKALSPYLKLREALTSAEATVKNAGEKMENLAKTEQRLRLTLETANSLAESLAQEVQLIAGVRKSIIEAEKKLEDRQRLGQDGRERLGRVQQMLKHCDYLQGQRKEKLEAQARASEQKVIYDELALAFGKNGIQAMIIDGAIPEIEREANNLLARMTDNRMHVAFETQREAKSGGVIETLDIKIADELGQRGYELYSGGEAFRANFAIRIALSKLLAHRAGAKLQTLIIDEGFGTQDSQGRERLVECINSIANDFEKILVITHIQELKDAFPTRIDVFKTAEGSQITVS